VDRIGRPDAQTLLRLRRIAGLQRDLVLARAAAGLVDADRGARLDQFLPLRMLGRASVIATRRPNALVRRAGWIAVLFGATGGM
jgi:hypothetical protein